MSPPSSPAVPRLTRPERRNVPAALTTWLQSRRPGNTWPVPAIAAAVAVLIGLGSVMNEGTQTVLAEVFMFVALAQSWNLIGGFTGYASFGQVAFFGAGAYTTGALMTDYRVAFWPALCAAVVVGALLGILAGVPLLRLRGHYFAIATLGLAAGMQEVVTNLGRLTGGGAGITIPAFGTKAPTPFPGNAAFYVYFLLTAGVSVALVLVISHSRLGYAMRAIHQDEDGAAAVGINTTAVKVAAFALSGAVAAAVGAFYGFQQVHFEPPQAFDANITVLMVIMVVLGGSGSVIGPVVGAVTIDLLSQFLRANAPPGYSPLLLGIIIVLAAVFFPQGIVPFMSDAWRQRKVSFLDNIRKYRL
jgi:branched-chain amino acid transport system permease protein